MNEREHREKRGPPECILRKGSDCERVGGCCCQVEIAISMPASKQVPEYLLMNRGASVIVLWIITSEATGRGARLRLLCFLDRMGNAGKLVLFGYFKGGLCSQPDRSCSNVNMMGIGPSFVGPPG